MRLAAILKAPASGSGGDHGRRSPRGRPSAPALPARGIQAPDGSPGVGWCDCTNRSPRPRWIP